MEKSDTNNVYARDTMTFMFFFINKIGDDNINAAAGRPTRQSSLFHGLYGGAPERGNDGNINGDYRVGQSCTHTNIHHDYAWWAVDLESVYLVRSVVIYNRVDGNYVHFMNETTKSSQDQAKIVWQHQ